MKNKKYMKYLELKKEDAQTIYIFPNGIFYAVFDEDADLIHSLLGFVIKKMGNQYRKCEFPVDYFFRYRQVLEKMAIPYDIIDSNFERVDNIDKYNQDIKKIKIINKIEEINLDNKTPNEALNILYEIQNEIKNIR